MPRWGYKDRAPMATKISPRWGYKYFIQKGRANGASLLPDYRYSDRGNAAAYAAPRTKLRGPGPTRMINAIGRTISASLRLTLSGRINDASLHGVTLILLTFYPLFLLYYKDYAPLGLQP